MPRGGYRPGAGRPKGSTKAPAAPATLQDAHIAPDGPTHCGEELPLEYMLKVMNDPQADQSRRDRMAIAAAPFSHSKVGEGGKKPLQKEAAEAVGRGKFCASGPPKLAVVKSA